MATFLIYRFCFHFVLISMNDDCAYSVQRNIPLYNRVSFTLFSSWQLRIKRWTMSVSMCITLVLCNVTSTYILFILSLSSLDVYKACLSFVLSMIWSHEVALNKYHIPRVAGRCFSISSLVTKRIFHLFIATKIRYSEDRKIQWNIHKYRYISTS